MLEITKQVVNVDGMYARGERARYANYFLLEFAPNSRRESSILREACFNLRICFITEFDCKEENRIIRFSVMLQFRCTLITFFFRHKTPILRNAN